jgi:hypothetical protein
MDELNMPQLFIIVPVDTKVWSGGLKCDPTALYMNTVKLIFICEHSFHTCGEGFTIKQPKEFIKRWGPAIQTSLWALQLAVKVASACAGVPLPKIPQLDGLDVSSSLAFLNNVSAYFEHVCYKHTTELRAAAMYMYIVLHVHGMRSYALLLLYSTHSAAVSDKSTNLFSNYISHAGIERFGLRHAQRST